MLEFRICVLVLTEIDNWNNESATYLCFCLYCIFLHSLTFANRDKLKKGILNENWKWNKFGILNNFVYFQFCIVNIYITHKLSYLSIYSKSSFNNRKEQMLMIFLFFGVFQILIYVLIYLYNFKRDFLNSVLNFRNKETKNYHYIHRENNKKTISFFLLEAFFYKPDTFLTVTFLIWLIEIFRVSVPKKKDTYLSFFFNVFWKKEGVEIL